MATERQVLKEFAVYRFPQRGYTAIDMKAIHKVVFRTLLRKPRTIEITAMRFHPVAWVADGCDPTKPVLKESRAFRLVWRQGTKRKVLGAVAGFDSSQEAVKTVRITTARDLWQCLIDSGYTPDPTMHKDFASTVKPFIETPSLRALLVEHGFIQ